MTTKLLNVFGWEVVKHGKFFYFANADRTLVSPGFNIESSLHKYASNFLATPSAIEKCAERAIRFYPLLVGDS